MKPFLRFYPTVFAVVLICGGCAHQPKVDHAEDLKQLQAMAGEQEAQGKRVEQRQDEILAQLQQLQTLLTEQKELLATKPQVIEKVTRIACPPVAAQINQNIKPVKEQPNTDKLIVGLRENILLTGVNLVMSAKVSPQLNYSILDARNIQMFERNSEEWVRFTLYNPENNEPHVLERKLQGFQNIQGVNKTQERRPVVEVRFAVGKLKQKGQFVLADRSHSDFRMLLGRNLLRDVMLVDVSGENLIPVIREEKDKKETENKDKKE
jgi:hypothetical protein